MPKTNQYTEKTAIKHYRNLTRGKDKINQTVIDNWIETLAQDWSMFKDEVKDFLEREMTASMQFAEEEKLFQNLLLHPTQLTILNYLHRQSITQSDYERFCDDLGLRYLSLNSLEKFKTVIEG